MQDGHSSKTQGRAPRRGWGRAGAPQLPVGTSPGWGLVSCLPAVSLADPFTNSFFSLGCFFVQVGVPPGPGFGCWL